MKILPTILCLSVLTTRSFAQGLVSFANGPTSLISISTTGDAFSASPVGSYYFALLTASGASGPFTFTGIYATNSTLAGRFGPSSYTPAVPGWAPQTTMFYEVAGWSASLGATFNPAWIISPPPVTAYFFGVSAVASGSAGGGSPIPAPPLPLFGGSGLEGFTLNAQPLPEPSGISLAALAAASVFVFRGRKLARSEN